MISTGNGLSPIFHLVTLTMEGRLDDQPIYFSFSKEEL
jgi:hypothetical protein